MIDFRTNPSHTSLCVCTPFEQKNRDLAGRFLLILPIGRKHGDRLRKCLVPLIASQQSRGSSKRFVPELNRDIGMSQQVVVPQRVFWCAFFGRDGKVIVPRGNGYEWIGAWLTRFGPCGCEKDQRNRAFYFASMRTKFLNNATIPYKPILYTHFTHV